MPRSKEARAFVKAFVENLQRADVGGRCEECDAGPTTRWTKTQIKVFCDTGLCPECVIKSIEERRYTDD